MNDLNPQGLVTEAYKAELERRAESDCTRKYKRKADTQSEEVVLRPKKRHGNLVSLPECKCSLIGCS